jgi:AbrB family looped-hinge helix DNA binding protein
MEVKVSPKFQIVIPKEIRKQLGVMKGQRLQIIVRNGIISLVPERSLKDLRGSLQGMDLKGIREEGRI